MEPFTLIIFGITGNLASLLLIPALYDLEEKGLLPADSHIVGIARRPLSPQEFEKYIVEVLTTQNQHHQHGTNPQVVRSLARRIHYLQGDFETSTPQSGAVYEDLKSLLGSFGASGVNHLYYLATYPSLYSTIFRSLQQHGLNDQTHGWARLMIEKPLGTDLTSAQELDRLLKSYFAEDQIYRLDHYLGKETIQNLLVFRFGNGFLAPLMNRNFVDHIQITWSKNFGIGKRGGYYDSMGAMRDVGQNHLLQMLVVATMDCPAEFSNRAITDERIKVLKSLKPNPEKIVFGQYNGYLYEDKVSPASQTDTFFALRTEIMNDTWAGVPIYMRAGKYLAQSVTEISIVFKAQTRNLFAHQDLADRPNVLTYRIEPNEGIGLEMLTKHPGHKFSLDKDYLQFCYRSKKNTPADAYERLIYDALSGDPTFFNDFEEVEASWNFVDTLLPHRGQPLIYEPGSWGPDAANALIESDGRSWIEPSPILCSI